jgi:predicted PurR-regulated permease PerM
MDAPPRRILSPELRGRLILFFLWVCLALVIVAFRQVLLPFAIAFVIAYLLEPAVGRISRWKVRGRAVPRWAAVIALYAIFFLILYFFLAYAVPRLFGELSGLTRAGKRLLDQLTPERIADVSRRLEEWLGSRGIPVGLSGEAEAPRYGLSLDVERSIRQGLDNFSELLRSHFLEGVAYLRKLVAGVLGFVFRFFFILMVAAFILVDWRPIGRFLRKMVPQARRGDWDELMTAIDQKLSGVVRGQAMICVVNGALTALGLFILRVPFLFILTALATALSVIPIFGTILSSVPIVLIALTRGFRTGLLALGWIVGIHLLEAYVLNPRIMGRQAQIHPVVVAFALLAGETAYGVVGALLAVPLTGVLAAAFELARERALRGDAGGGGPKVEVGDSRADSRST